MKASILVLLFCIFTGSNASSNCPAPCRSSDCPTPEWFVAEFVSIADQVLSPPISLRDSNLSFFREVMLFTEEEIARVEKDAIQFYNTRFGLNFSQSEPDELRQRFYQNATFFPAKESPELHYAATFSEWIVSGKTKSVCFENNFGIFGVEFSGEQLLYGTYGGEKGIPVTSTASLAYGFNKISVCPQEPLVIQFSSATPVHFDPQDGFLTINLDLFHRVWGHGLMLGLNRISPTGDGRVHFIARDVYTFPAHPTVIPCAYNQYRDMYGF